MSELTGKAAPATGVGEGICARTAEVLAEAGALVLANCHDAHFGYLDVTKGDDCRSVIADVCSTPV